MTKRHADSITFTYLPTEQHAQHAIQSLFPIYVLFFIQVPVGPIWLLPAASLISDT